MLAETLRDPVVVAAPSSSSSSCSRAVSFHVFSDNDLRGYERRDAATSITMGLGSLVFTAIARGLALIGYAALYEVTPLRLDPAHWTTWVGVLLAVDLLWYAYHRSSHRIRLLWAAHQAHHNSTYFNYSTAVRQKWNPWFEVLFWTPLPLLGVPPWMIFTAFSVNLVYQFLVHTERVGRLPRPIEFVFNTPSHHRVHHASDLEYLDRNYGGILIVWDRLFGTFAEEAHRPTYGLTHPVGTRSILGLQYREFGAIARDVRTARGWRERVGYVLRPPGWRPPAGV
ncbi:sterol desaturase family protein [Actinomycetospora rhizophila]|uniref:Sterol desaturase family protein n=1 Tax=Actinomycetospora rhizophila TaxID=1416876 RepID=A0ABV9Z8W4_9PSEU